MVIYIFFNLECSGSRLEVSILSGPNELWENRGEVRIFNTFTSRKAFSSDLGDATGTLY